MPLHPTRPIRGNRQVATENSAARTEEPMTDSINPDTPMSNNEDLSNN